MEKEGPPYDPLGVRMYYVRQRENKKAPAKPKGFRGT